MTPARSSRYLANRRPDAAEPDPDVVFLTRDGGLVWRRPVVDGRLQRSRSARNWTARRQSCDEIIKINQ
jgi:hypothetical protein